MQLIVRFVTLAALVSTMAAPVDAQTREGVMGELLRDLEQVEKKMVDLAKAMPDEAFAWRPGAGVRSTSETLLHVAADNYFLPALLGVEVPAETGINGRDFKTTVAFEKRSLRREQVIAELQKSFAFLKDAMQSTPDAKLAQTIKFFGQESTTRGLWITTVTHLHEHLGQLIAYARSNNVTPPWSK